MVSAWPVRCRQSSMWRKTNLAQEHRTQTADGVVLRLLQRCHQLAHASVWLLLALVEHALRLRSLLVGIGHELAQQLLKGITICEQVLDCLLGHLWYTRQRASNSNDAYFGLNVC